MAAKAENVTSKSKDDATSVVMYVRVPIEIANALRAIAVEEDRPVARELVRALKAHVAKKASSQLSLTAFNSDLEGGA